MLLRIDDRRTRYLLFVLLALTINLVDSAATRSVVASSRHFLVAAAASADVILIVSLLYYWLLVRPGIRARGSLTFIALLGVLHATYFWPLTNTVRASLAGLSEMGLIGFVALRSIHGRSQGESDPLDAVQQAVSSFLPPLAARMLAAELTVLYYALFALRSKPHVPAGARPFSTDKIAGKADLLSSLSIACGMEIVPVHLLLHRWTVMGAWIATATSLYGMIWLHGLARSIKLRPVLVGPDYLDIRYGLLFRLHVQPHRIAGVRQTEAGEICMEFTDDQTAHGLFGVRRQVNRIAVTADEPRAFQQALAQLIQN